MNYSDFLAPPFPTRPFYLTKEISKYTKENMQAEHFGSHFSRNGPINLIFRPDCYIFKDASLDTYISITYVRHLSSLTSNIWHK